MEERHQFEYFEPEVAFGHDNKVSIAVAFLSWDLKNNPLDDWRIGEIKFMLKSWGIPDTGFLTELKTHYCTEDEINDIEGTKTNSTFYPISKLSSIDVKAYIGRFKCLDEPEKLVLRGNYDT